MRADGGCACHVFGLSQAVGIRRSSSTQDTRVQNYGPARVFPRGEASLASANILLGCRNIAETPLCHSAMVADAGRARTVAAFIHASGLNLNPGSCRSFGAR